MPKFDKAYQAYSKCFMALGEWRLGRVAEANKYLAEAKELDPNCIALEGVAREFMTAD
jgi:hypothetical protein